MKNYAIEWYRYFFACFICILHFKEYFGNPYPFGGAYLSVEFFFIVSGFFLMKSILAHNTNLDAESSTISFLKKRVKRLYPQYLLSWTILAIYWVFVRQSLTVKDLAIYYLDEVLMLQMMGAGKTLNAAMWYVSAMLIVSIVIYYVAKKHTKMFTHILAPIIVLVIYSHYYQSNGSLAGIGWKHELIVYNGIWRALAGVCLGCIVYSVYLYIKDKPKYPVIGSLYEIAVLCLLSVMFYRAGCTVKDFTLVGLMGLLVLSIMHNNSYLSQFLNRFKVDGTYAYAMYCNHWVINYFIRDFFPGYPFYLMVVIYLAATIVVSVITTNLIRTVENKLLHIHQ